MNISVINFPILRLRWVLSSLYDLQLNRRKTLRIRVRKLVSTFYLSFISNNPDCIRDSTRMMRAIQLSNVECNVTKSLRQVQGSRQPRKYYLRRNDRSDALLLTAGNSCLEQE